MKIDQTKLIQLIRDAVSHYQQEVEKMIEDSNSTFEKYQEARKSLEENRNAIITLTEEEIAEILSETSLREEEREIEFSFLKSIKRLLELNETRNTTYQLSENQKSYLSKFIEQIKEVEEEEEKKAKNNLQEASLITDKLKELRRLLGILEDPKNKEYIEDLDLITELMQKEELEDALQTEILYAILEYNQNLYEEQMSKEEIVEVKRLNIEEVKALLQEYNYEFDFLKEKDQEVLLSYGNLDKMRSILDCMNEYRFPRFDIKRNGKKFVAILINATPEIMGDIVEYSREKGISPKDLLMLVPALVKQQDRRKERSKDNHISSNVPYISGRSEDYKKNVEFLEGIGFDIRYIYSKCKEILIMPNSKLVSNYRKFVLYGFTIPTDEYGDLCHPALSCLVSNNFDEIVDQFIEISREGHQYIKDNMSRITTTTSPQDLLFYNMYASYMDQDELGEYMVPEGPFSGANHKTLKLRGEITRYNGSGYEKTPYRGITEENKREKTMTVEITCQNKEEFDQAVQDTKDREDELYNLVFNDERILALEEYVDIQDPLRYDFDGVIISKQKVLRIFNILKNNHLDGLEDSLLYALTYNSILSQDELDKVIKVVKDRRK